MVASRRIVDGPSIGLRTGDVGHRARMSDITVHDDRHRLTAGEVLRFVLAAVLLVAIVVLCAKNTGDTRVDYVFGDVEAPLWLVLAAAAIGGALVAALLRRRRHHA
jgi:uncharacterized integral membrane protein